MDLFTRLREVTAAATASAAGPSLVAAGYTPVVSGGGMFAWERCFGARMVWITIDDEELQGRVGTELGDGVPLPEVASWIVGIYPLDDNGCMTEKSHYATVIGLSKAIALAAQRVAEPGLVMS